MARDIGSEGAPGEGRAAARPEGAGRRELRGPNPLGAAIPSTLLGRDPGEGRIVDAQRERTASRGPRGWRRSDDRILDELAEAIARSGVDASEVEVTVTGGVVRLAGTVEHREDRRMIDDLAWGTTGVDEVEDAIRVRRRP